ncbi:MAG: hypothetical protein WHT08_01030 [Bryobacteraceae bacterium]
MFRRAASLLVLVLALSSCRTASEKKRITGPLRPGAASDAARFLAGLPGRGTSPFKALESTDAWQDHRRRLDFMFRDFRERREPQMREFARSELSRREDLACPVFYPFSGADALTLLTLFPGRRTYVMAALEPPGRVPDAPAFPPESLPRLLPPLAETLESLLRKSFFVTREMDRQLRGQNTDGVAQPLLIQLARAGYEITGHEYVRLDENGHPQPRRPDVRRAEFGHNRGLRFDLMPREGGRGATLYYFSVNLDNAHLRANPQFRRFLSSLGPVCTMLKATSYLLHDRGFSEIRDAVLQHSVLILQDDTGIPWRLLASGAWEVQLYGDYERPYGKAFAFRLQRDLRAAYEDPRRRVKPLRFRIGYGAGRVTSNLQVARRLRTRS